MPISTTAKFSSLLRYESTITSGEQSSTEKYSLGLTKSIPTGTGSASYIGRSGYFSNYAKSTGTLAAGANLEIDLSGFIHQKIDGTTVTRIFSHVNSFLFESSNATGVSDVLVVGTTGTNAFVDMFNGGSGSLRVTPYSSFLYTDYYGTPVTHDSRLVGVRNTAGRTLNYRYMAIGQTGAGRE